MSDKNDIREELKNLQKRLFDLSARNPFIDAKPAKLYFLSDDNPSRLKKLYQSAQFYQKEYDLDVTLKVELFLKWKEPGKEQFFCSPILYRPCKIKRKRKIEEIYTLEEEEGSLMVNPVLRYSFERFFDLALPESVQDKDEFSQWVIDNLSTKKFKINLSEAFNEVEEWQLINTVAIGNFNYQKSRLGADYELIEKECPKLIEALLFAQSTKKEENSIELHPVLNLDYSQIEAVRSALQQPTVIQGPPGTGKSHTIVDLIAEFLQQDKKVLFVSQKRSALEVVFERLRQLKLDALAGFLNTERNEKKIFYQSLKNTWTKLSQPTTDQFEQSSEPYSALVDFYLNKYDRFVETLNGSIADVVKQLSQCNVCQENLEAKGTVPKINEWSIHYQELLKLDKALSAKKLAIHELNVLNKAIFTEQEPLIKLEKRLTELEVTLASIAEIQRQFNLSGNLEEITRLALAASVLKMVDKSQLDLLNPETKRYKSFRRLAKKYHSTKAKLNAAEKANQSWTSKPSLSEIIQLIDLIEHHEAPRGIFGFLKRNPARVEETFKDFDKQLSDRAKIQLLESLRAEHHLRAELEELKVKLKHDFFIQDPDNEVDHVLYVRNKLVSLDESIYLTLLEHPEKNQLLEKLSKIHPKLEHFNHLTKFIWNETPSTQLESFQNEINHIKKLIPLINEHLVPVQGYFEMPQQVLAFLRNNQANLSTLNARVLYNNLLIETRFYPEFEQLSGDKLLKSIKQLIAERKKYYSSNVRDLMNRYAHQLKKLESLLATPAAKLKQKEKDHKKDLKSAKRKLIHEMNKVQQHAPLREFFQETREYLMTLHPVWMMNPLSVSERLPAIQGLFDVVIFDESSQIPLEDSLPAIYRARQIVVVGDRQQMPPSKFFSANASGNTILDQAELSLNKHMLKYHYRSQHPDLIRFSNAHFYNNQLIVPPPASAEQSIEWLHLNGIFEDGANVIEARKIADDLKQIETVERKNVGVVAFSRQQEQTIRKYCEKSGIDLTEVLISNLENVQGIERDEIWISIGYAKNKEGVFRLNFGPVNQENGRNRLNVLFTRAKQKMRIYSSIKAEDFGLSDNQGVMCLKDFLQYIQDNINQSSSQKIHKTVLDNYESIQLNGAYYAYQLSTEKHADFLCNLSHTSASLINPAIHTRSNRDLITQFILLQSRFKNLHIILSKDIWKRSSDVNELLRNTLK